MTSSASSASSASSTVTTTFPQIRSRRDLACVLEDLAVSQIVQDRIDTYYSIDPLKAMEGLGQVGQFLRLALAGSKGYPCSEQIIRILSLYQTVIFDTAAASNRFISTSLRALQLHFMALTLPQDASLETIVQVVGPSKELALKMVEETDKLIKSTEAVSDAATVALQEATKNQNVSAEELRQLEKTLKAQEVSKAKFEATKAALETDIQTLIREEKQAEHEERKAFRVASAVSVVSTLLEPVTLAIGGIETVAKLLTSLSKKKDASQATQEMNNAITKLKSKIAEKEIELAKKRVDLDHVNGEEKVQLEKEIAVLETQIQQLEKDSEQQQISFRSLQDRMDQRVRNRQEKLTRIIEHKRALLEQDRQATVALAGNLAQMKSVAQQQNTISQAVVSLDITLQNLGRIRTAFEKARGFWKSMADQSDALLFDAKNVKDLAILGFRKQVVEKIFDSGINWLALGRLSEKASLTIEAAKESVNAAMDNLPSEKQAAALVDKLTSELGHELDQERTRLEQEAKTGGSLN